MFLTENYAIVIDSSLRADPTALVSFKKMHTFNESLPIRFGVMPRKSPSPESIIWVEAEFPGYIWHSIAAWEEDDNSVTLFAPKFNKYNENIDIHLETEQPSYLTKFKLNLETKKATEEKILDLIVERPSVNTDHLSPTITYLRSEGVSSREMGGEIVKYDLKKQEIVGRFSCQPKCSFGEPLFVSSKKPKSEDDGYLMDIVYYPATNSSAFLVLDAATMTPVVLADLPQRVPYGVHGLWLENDYFKE